VVVAAVAVSAATYRVEPVVVVVAIMEEVEEEM